MKVLIDTNCALGVSAVNSLINTQGGNYQKLVNTTIISAPLFKKLVCDTA